MLNIMSTLLKYKSVGKDVIISKPPCNRYGNPAGMIFATITLRPYMVTPSPFQKGPLPVIDKTTPVFSKQFDLRHVSSTDVIEIDGVVVSTVTDLLKFQHNNANPVHLTYKNIMYRVSVEWGLTPNTPTDKNDQEVTIVYRNDLTNTDLDVFIGYYCYNNKKSIGLMVNNYKLDGVTHTCECGQVLTFSPSNKLMNHHHVTQAPYLQNDI